MRHPGVEHDQVARLGQQRHDLETGHHLRRARCRRGCCGRKTRSLASQGDLEAAVVERERVDGHHQGQVVLDAEVDVRRRVLVRREARAAGQLEVDLVLEQDDRLAAALGEQRRASAAPRSSAARPAWYGTKFSIRASIFAPRGRRAPLVVAHPGTGHLGPGAISSVQRARSAISSAVEEAAQPHPAVALPVFLRGRVEHRSPGTRARGLRPPR